MPRATAILEFWFGALDAAGVPAPEVERRWFHGDERLDAEIRARFEADLRNAAAGRLVRWEDEARSALALVILFDQFPRNMYRGTPRAFLFDEHARAVAARAIRAGHEGALWPLERAFLYLPFEHAESADDQAAAVRRFSTLIDAVPEEQRHRFRAFLHHAERHRDVIERFGRFPHRNAVLGRESTPQEEAFLEAGGLTGDQGRGDPRAHGR